MKAKLSSKTNVRFIFSWH